MKRVSDQIIYLMYLVRLTPKVSKKINGGGNG